MHDSTGHGGGGQNPHLNHHDGSAAASTGHLPGTEPIEPTPDGTVATPAEGRSRFRRSSSGSRIHGGLSSWETRAKLAVVVSFVVLVAILIMNRPWLKSKSSKSLLAQVPPRTTSDKGPKPDDAAGTGEQVPARDEPESPPRAPTATADGKSNEETPPRTPAPFPTAKPLPSTESLPRDLTDETPKPTDPVADGKDDAPPLDPPTSKPAEQTGAGAALADAPPPPVADKKPRNVRSQVADDKQPPLTVRKPASFETIESVPKGVNDETGSKPEASEDPSRPANRVASMPPLSPTPPTVESGKTLMAEAPTVGVPESRTESGYAIPSAGLVRTSDSPAKKSPASNPVVSAPGANATAAISASGADDGTLHVVRRGENFWTIARYHYASGRFYKALWYANRDLAKTPEDLYVGTAIRIPPVEDLNRELIEAPRTARADNRPSAAAMSRKTSPRDGSAERTAGEGEPQASLPVDKADSTTRLARQNVAQPKREPEATYRTYVVRGRNETLRSVARTQLGDSDREDEIQALNRDEFSDNSTRLRVGMTLKLPNDSRTR